jgi:hypothetical protein
MRRQHILRVEKPLRQAKMKQPPTIEEQHQIVEEIVQTSIEWESDVKGYFLCPMHEGHSTPTKDKHTVVYLEGVPTFFCWHQSCKEWMESASCELREKLDFRTPEEKAESRIKAAERTQLKYDAMRLKMDLNRIYKDFAWESTGKKGEVHFKTAEEWKGTRVNFYANHYTTGSAFKPGTTDRTNANVLLTPYIIVEFDSLVKDPEENKRNGAALLKYLSAAFDLTMVVDSGNKSCHGWFLNNEKMTQEAKFFLRQLGADMQTMRPSQPVRLPGGRRENGRIQSVLYVRD